MSDSNQTQTGPPSSTSPAISVKKIADRLEAANLSFKKGSEEPGDLEQNGEELRKRTSDLELLLRYQLMILENSSQGILFVDLDGNVITFNKAAELILNATAEEVIYHPFWKNFSDKMLGFSLREALRNLKPPKMATSTIRDERNGNKNIEVEVSIVQHATIKDEASTPYGETQDISGLIILIRDVTEIKHQEVISQRKHRMSELSEMAAMVAHEIRNPLGGIKGFASLLERDLVDRPELKKMATYIIDGTNNLNDLVTRVLTYSRPIKTHFETVDLISLINHIREEILKEDAFSRNIAIEIQSDESTLLAVVDKQTIRSSIINLIMNAIEAMPDGGGRITITAKKDDLQILISISDTGVGIPPENLKKIFSPFFTTRPDGNGFGLSEVHKIAQLHGGKVEVESQVGIGSTFTLKLPLNKVEAAKTTTPENAEESL